MKKSLWLAIISASTLALGACGTSDSHTLTDDGGAGAEASVSNHDGGAEDAATVSDGGGGDAVVAQDSGPDAEVPLTVETLPRALAELLCAKAECLASDGNQGLLISLVVIGGTTGADCVDRVEGFARNGNLLLPNVAIAADRAAFDVTVARACIDELAADEGCSFIREDTSCLDTIFTGNVASGDECSRDEDANFNECAAGLTCVRPAGTTEGCAMHCESLIALGEACSMNEQCGFDTGSDTHRDSCEDDPEVDGFSTVCFAVNTVFDADAGDPCNERTRDGYVYSDHQCREGTYCDETGESPVCAALESLGGLGDPCVEGYFSSCEVGLACIANTCSEIELHTTAETSCGISESGIAICDSASGVACEVTAAGEGGFIGTCKTLDEDGSEGTFCGGAFSRAFGFGLCDSGLFCDVLTDDFPGIGGVCSALRADGEGCDRSNQCDSGNCQWDSEHSEDRCAPAVCEL